MFSYDKYYFNLNYTLSPPDTLYSCLKIYFMETIHHFLPLFEQNHVWFTHGKDTRKLYYDHHMAKF